MMLHYSVAILACLVVLASTQDGETPPFLQGATADQVKKFYDLFGAENNKTDAQIEVDVEAFVNQLGGNFPQQFENYKKQLKQRQAEYEREHALATEKFSLAAKEADKRMSEIANNPNLTGAQKAQQIKAIMDSLPKNVQDEIKAAISQ